MHSDTQTLRALRHARIAENSLSVMDRDRYPLLVDKMKEVIDELLDEDGGLSEALAAKVCAIALVFDIAPGSAIGLALVQVVELCRAGGEEGGSTQG